MGTIGFIGTGEIASAMVLGLIGRGHQIYVCERNITYARQLAQNKDVSILENQALINASETVVLCLMKEVALEILPHLSFNKNQRVISVMVDVSLDQLSLLCAPAHQIEITIPLPFIATGGCPLPCYPSDQIVSDWFGDNNPVLKTNTEIALNAHFAATAMASVIFDQARSAAIWLGEITGNNESAEIYLSAMLGGFFNSLPQDGQQQFQAALNKLSTQGGLNATLRAYFESEGVLDVLSSGLDGFRERLALPRKK